MSHTSSLSTTPLTRPAGRGRAAAAHRTRRASLATRGWTIARVLLMPGAAAQELRAIPVPGTRDDV